MCDNLCPECGMPPGECYRICPTQDPYGGDQMAEHYDHEFNARYDDVRERYAATVADADMFFSDEDHGMFGTAQPAVADDDSIPF